MTTKYQESIIKITLEPCLHNYVHLCYNTFHPGLCIITTITVLYIDPGICIDLGVYIDPGICRFALHVGEASTSASAMGAIY